MRPVDLPPPEHYAHGTRARYVSGCRCDDCRRANSAYAKMRDRMKNKGDWNGLVRATKARHHLQKLSAAGVGRRTVQDISGVGDTTLQEVRSGKKKFIRASTEKAILSVTADATNDAKLVDPGDLLDRLEALRKAHGWTGRELARRMGFKGNAIQFKRHRMTARNILRVEKFIRANPPPTRVEDPPEAPRELPFYLRIHERT